jgi:hypothetical protein
MTRILTISTSYIPNYITCHHFTQNYLSYYSWDGFHTTFSLGTMRDVGVFSFLIFFWARTPVAICDVWVWLISHSSMAESRTTLLQFTEHTKSANISPQVSQPWITPINDLDQTQKPNYTGRQSSTILIMFQHKTTQYKHCIRRNDN